MLLLNYAKNSITIFHEIKILYEICRPLEIYAPLAAFICSLVIFWTRTRDLRTAASTRRVPCFS